MAKNQIIIIAKNMRNHALMRLFQLRPISKNKVIFRSYHGTKYNDSPMYISEALSAFAQKQEIDVDIVWITDGTVLVPDGVRTVMQGSTKALYELATAKVWVDNVRKDLWDRKRKEQFYIQTWHAGTALKMVEKDASIRLSHAYVKRARNDSRMADVFISASKDNSNLYRNAFWYDGEILEYGCPRSDIFYQETNKYKIKVFEYFGLDKEDRLVLYAPTFRNSGSLECYSIEYKNFLKALEQQWGGNWKVIIRLHPNLAEKQNEIPYGENILNGSSYPDINEIIIASDLLITDYSSCMFDAMEAKKRVFLYAPDEEAYMSERGMYFQLNELPFPVAHNNTELINCISSFVPDEFDMHVKAFMDKLGFVNDGMASERCAQLILNQMGLN